VGSGEATNSVLVGVMVGVAVRVKVGVIVGVDVIVDVDVMVAVPVRLGRGDAVNVAVGGSGVRVAVALGVDVAVSLGTGVLVSEGGGMYGVMVGTKRVGVALARPAIWVAGGCGLAGLSTGETSKAKHAQAVIIMERMVFAMRAIVTRVWRFRRQDS